MQLTQGDQWYHIKASNIKCKKYIFKYIQYLRKDKNRITTMIVFKKVAEIYILFKGGKETKYYIYKIIIWSYKLFERSFSL